jgi:hypothetical protein
MQAIVAAAGDADLLELEGCDLGNDVVILRTEVGVLRAEVAALNRKLLEASRKLIILDALRLKQVDSLRLIMDALAHSIREQVRALEAQAEPTIHR